MGGEMTRLTQSMQIGTLILLLLAGPPAHAQTMAEAAWANMAVAVQLCETRTSDMNAWAQAFRDTGFSEQVERSGSNSDTTHF